MELEYRLAAYHVELREFWLKQVPFLAIICAAVAFGMTWSMLELSGAQLFNTDWRVMGAIISVGLMILPVQMLYPERPTLASIEHDRVLNQIGHRLTAR